MSPAFETERTDFQATPQTQLPAQTSQPASRTSFVLILVAVVAGMIGGWLFVVRPPEPTTPLPSPTDVPRAASMSASSAYAAIPHRRTRLAASKLECEPRERAYLRVMFAAIDQGVALRVSGLRAFGKRKYSDRYVNGYDNLREFVAKVPPPRTLRSYHSSVLAAIDAQRKFFGDWQEKGDEFSLSQIASHRQVRKSSKHLIRAYNKLMRIFPKASQRNRHAFFDYHCAFDFL